MTGEIGGSFDVGTGLGRHLTFVPRVKEARAAIPLSEAAPSGTAAIQHDAADVADS